MNGLAEYWEIIALFIGVILIVAEIFVLPGFGVAGIAGITLTVVSLILIMLNNDFFNFEFVPLGDIVVATTVAFAGLTGGMVVLFVGGSQIMKSKAFQRMALTETQESSKGYTVNTQHGPMAGKTGTAYTVLRPSGKVIIEEQIFDAFTRGDYVEKGESIIVIEREGVTLKVKRANA